MHSSNVVFLAPFGPMTPTISFSRTENEMFLRTVESPKRLGFKFPATDYFLCQGMQPNQGNGLFTPTNVCFPWG